MKFRLTAESTLDEVGEKTEINKYIIEYDVVLLKRDESKGVRYIKDLKIYVEEKSAIEYIYQIETVNVDLALCKRLNKATEIHRQLFSRYDFIHFRVNGNGKILKILNEEDLNKVWSKLKNRIFKHYKGYILEHFIKALDNDYKKGTEPRRSVNQYLHFALLFPHIPQVHSEQWEKKRQVRCYEYEDIRFEETIKYLKTEDNLRYYNITANVAKDSTAKIIYYDGSVCVPKEDIFAQYADIKIKYEEGGQQTSWDFTLERI